MNKDIEKRFLDELDSKIDRALILARESTSPSVSEIMQKFVNKLDLHIKTHEEDVKSIKDDIAVLKKSVEPAVSAINTANTLKRGVTWIAGFIIAIGVISGSIVALKSWLKH